MVSLLRYGVACVCFILLFFASASLMPVLAAYDDARGFETAAALLNDGRYLEALAAYQEVATYSETPDHRAGAFFFMGTIYSLYLDQHTEALKIYELISKDYPESPHAEDALFNSGMVHYGIGQFKKAHSLFIRYIEKYPQGEKRQSAEVWADSSLVPPGSQDIPPAPAAGVTTEDQTIRVLLKEEIVGTTIGTRGAIVFSDSLSGKRLLENSGPVSVAAKGGELCANGLSLQVRSCTAATPGGILSVDGNEYRGTLTIFARANDVISIVNNLPVESYLYAVVPKEMYPKWKMEALKTQAIAARTYALYLKEKNQDKPYDIKATVASQVYGGHKAETGRTNSAVDATRGEVMVYDNRLIIAYFHANSGGRTEAAGNVWVADLPYLRSIDDPFSAEVSESSWKAGLSYDDITAHLKRNGLSTKHVSRISILGSYPSGRASAIKVTSRGKDLDLKSNDFRIKMGADVVKSTLFRIRETGNGVELVGRGFGHGVGMSQWGANRMAQKGYTCKEILQHYYQGVQIVRLGEGV